MTLQIARLVGSAGSGKTSELLRIMDSALDHLGRDPLRLGFASFTRAARAEAVERASKAWNVSPDLLTSRGWFRTVHSVAYRCLGISGGQMIGNTQADIEWLCNALQCRIETSIDDDTGRQKFLGDPAAAAALNCWELCRATLQPLEPIVKRLKSIDDNVPPLDSIVRVCNRYEAAKRLDDRVDFSDLLLRFAGFAVDTTGVPYVRTPEGELPEVDAWLFDEQQDASALMDAACKRLVTAPSVRWCYIVGDPFQAIYGFAGSNADNFMAWHADKERIMPRSYRCPAPIISLGEQCLRRMKRGYFDRGVEPAPHDGSVSELNSIEDAASLANPGDNWLFIARTNYQAGRLMAALNAAHKPAKWTTSPDGRTARSVGLAALWALEHGEPITGQQWSRALELLPASSGRDRVPMLARGTKSRWKNGDAADQWDLIFPSDLPAIGATSELCDRIGAGKWVGLVDRGLEWREQALRHGPDLAAEPKIRVGTIHSVKGFEADNVAVLTTTSGQIENGMEDQTQHDEEHRIAYVAVTRTRHHLHVINEGRQKTPRMEIL
jgi:DNA helicase-2/ATP-dependent DNA helicase PcrA